ncbi:MAG: acyltransferase [Candidatus Sericytochromatia bacterium]|nr:acyltransferase [Candidatus Sericytochromatia bacterium]
MQVERRPSPVLPATVRLSWAARLNTWPAKLTNRFLHAWLPRCHPGVSLDPSVQLEGPSYWRIHPQARVRLAAGVWLRHHAELLVDGGELWVGEGTYIGPYAVLNVHDSVRIGRHCLIAEMVAIRDVDHAFADPTRPVSQQGYTVAPTQLEDGCWIGAKVSILKGVRIGAGCIVGAGSIVTRDLPAGCIAVGAPAKPIGWRDE